MIFPTQQPFFKTDNANELISTLILPCKPATAIVGGSCCKKTVNEIKEVVTLLVNY